ncbi:MAG: alpha/beta hydrolase [Pyrobaculum sp.]
MPYYRLDDGVIYYETFGVGEKWLVLIHGMFASGRWWKVQIEALSKKYRLLVPDLRGHGRSSPLERRVKLSKFSQDVYQLMSSLGVEKAVFVGWSLGGLVSLDLASRHPELTKGVVLVASRARRSFIRIAKVLGDYLRGKLYAAYATLFFTPSETQRLMRQFIVSEIEKELARRREEVVSWIVEEVVKNRVENPIAVIMSALLSDVRNRLKYVKAPVLIIAGGRDRSLPPKYSIEIYKNIPTSRLVVLEDCGHYAPVECGEEVNRLISNFLTEIGW